MTILNEYIYHYRDYEFGLSWYSLIGLGLIVCAVLIFFLLLKIDDTSLENIGIFLCTVFFMVGILIIFIRAPKIQTTRYEIILNDEITFNEFNDRYKLIEERGDILVVEEKEIIKNENG